MNAKWLIVAAAFCMFIGCGPSPSSVSNITPATATRLVTWADSIWKPAAGRQSVYEEVHPGQWPAEVQQLLPKAASITKDGVYIELWSLHVESRGLFVLPTQSSFQPKSGGDPSYRQLQQQVYWYEIKG